jgi:plasmid stabilization system protein ParE
LNAYTIQYDDGFWQDIKNVINWYDAISPDIGDRFLEEFWFAESRIADNPNAFSKVTHSGFRRVLLKKSPYKIYFKVEDKTIFVVALIHQRQLLHFLQQLNFSLIHLN